MNKMPPWPTCDVCKLPTGMPTRGGGGDELECSVCHLRWQGERAELDPAREVQLWLMAERERQAKRR
ncbi:hypothetical protein [Sorangium sp. So ce1335]|uniref:hypothetical protein n=1 Tax=Sorangium sp. So ce1335 TaxID=3133335 RepID=UPI003F60DB97